MKTYNSSNFFKYTFCEFKEVDNFDFPKNINFKSKSESQYYYTKDGVYRKSNHWGRVANCRWKLISKEKYKNQKVAIAYAKWSDFHPIHSSEKLFFITVNFNKKTAKIECSKELTKNYLFTYQESQLRLKQINQLFKDDKWAKYFDLEKEELYIKIITKFISSNKTLQEIKRSFK